MNKAPGIVEFEEDFVSPQQGDSVRARIEYLKADNARMQAWLKQREDEAVRDRIKVLKAENARMRAWLEQRYKARAEQLMSQLLSR